MGEHAAAVVQCEKSVSDLPRNTRVHTCTQVHEAPYAGARRTPPSLKAFPSGSPCARRPHTASQVRIVSPPDRKYSVWIGGSVLAALPSFQGAAPTPTHSPTYAFDPAHCLPYDLTSDQVGSPVSVMFSG